MLKDEYSESEMSMDFLYEDIPPTVFYNCIPRGVYVLYLKDITSARPTLVGYGGGNTYYLSFEAINLNNHVIFNGIHPRDKFIIDVPYKTFYNGLTRYTRKGLRRGTKYNALLILNRVSKKITNIEYFRAYETYKDSDNIIDFNLWCDSNPSYKHLKIKPIEFEEGFEMMI